MFSPMRARASITILLQCVPAPQPGPCDLQNSLAITGGALDAYSESVIVLTCTALLSLKLYAEKYSFSHASPAAVQPSARSCADRYQLR